eukprot:gene8474-948_t
MHLLFHGLGAGRRREGWREEWENSLLPSIKFLVTQAPPLAKFMTRLHVAQRIKTCKHVYEIHAHVSERNMMRVTVITTKIECGESVLSVWCVCVESVVCSCAGAGTASTSKNDNNYYADADFKINEGTMSEIELEPDVIAWLSSLKLEEYASTLSSHGITRSEDVGNLSEEKLVEIGVCKLGHRKRILKHTAVLKPSSSTTSTIQRQLAVDEDSNQRLDASAPPSDPPPPRPKTSKQVSPIQDVASVQPPNECAPPRQKSSNINSKAEEAPSSASVSATVQSQSKSVNDDQSMEPYDQLPPPKLPSKQSSISATTATPPRSHSPYSFAVPSNISVPTDPPPERPKPSQHAVSSHVSIDELYDVPSEFPDLTTQPDYLPRSSVR